MRERIVNDRRPDEREQQVRAELDSFGERPGDECDRDDREHALEHRVQVERYVCVRERLEAVLTRLLGNECLFHQFLFLLGIFLIGDFEIEVNIFDFLFGQIADCGRDAEADEFGAEADEARTQRLIHHHGLAITAFFHFAGSILLLNWGAADRELDERSTEGERVADDDPLHADEAERDHGVHHRAEDVFATGHTAIKQREARHHEHHECGGDEHPGDVRVLVRIGVGRFGGGERFDFGVGDVLHRCGCFRRVRFRRFRCILRERRHRVREQDEGGQ